MEEEDDNRAAVMKLADDLVSATERQVEQTPFIFVMRHADNEKDIILRSAIPLPYTSLKMYHLYQLLTSQWASSLIDVAQTAEFVGSDCETFLPIPEPTSDFLAAVTNLKDLLELQTIPREVSKKSLWMLVYQTSRGFEVFGGGKNCTVGPIIPFIHLVLKYQNCDSLEINFPELISMAGHLRSAEVSKAVEELAAGQLPGKKKRRRKLLQEESLGLEPMDLVADE